MVRITVFSKIGLAIAAITVALPKTALAITLASDNSEDAAYNSGWADNSNGGFGYGAWSLHPTTNTVNNGFFTASATNNDGGGASSGNINVGGDSFGIYANSNNRSAAFRAFNLTDGRTALQVGDTFSWKMDNGFVFDPGSSVGLSLRNGAANSDASDTTIFSGRRFAFEFLQGSTNYSILDSTGIRDTGIAFRRTGVDLSFTLTGLNTYSAAVKDVSSGATLNTITGTLGGTADQALNSFAVYNRFAGSAGDEDLFFNSFVVNIPFTTTWSAANPGDMLAGSNWAGGNAPNSTDAIANIATQPTGDGNFALNSTMTLGTLNYSNSRARTINGKGTLNLAVSSGSPEISVNGGNLTIGSTITGSSGLKKTGSSSLVLFGSNAYTGTSTVSAGTLTVENSTGSGTGSGDIMVNGGSTLAIGIGLSSGAVSGNITDNGTVQFNKLNSITYSGQISGTGSVTKLGAGTLTLTGSNTYVGGTNINTGTVALGSSGALSNSSKISFGGGTLQFSATNTTDYSARFSNAGNQQFKLDTNGQDVTLASAPLYLLEVHSRSSVAGR